LPPKRWKKSRKFRQIWGKCIIDPTRNRVWHRLGHKVITLPENLGKLSRVPFMKVSAPHICLCSSRGVGCLIMVEGSNDRRRWTVIVFRRRKWHFQILLYLFC
jgi:hypothetical protein